MTFESLDNVLRRFYAEARTKTGEEYRRSTLGIRNALERHLAGNGREVKITKNSLFVKFNKMLESKLKLNRREGRKRKTQVCHSEGRHREAKKQSISKFQRPCRSSPPSLVCCNLVLVLARMRESKTAQNG